MKHKILFVIGTIMIVSGIITSFVSSFAKDVSETKKINEEIENKYLEFKDILTILNGERETLYNDVINELYIETVEQNYSTWLTTYEGYKKTIENISNYQGFIKEKCFNINYTDSNIQSKCDSMMLSYETAINYYVKDVHKFNSFIETYNANVEEVNKKGLIELTEYNYIDFNDDSRYTGK